GIRAGESGYYLFNVETADVRREAGTASLNSGFSTDRARRFIAQASSSMDSLGEIAVYDRQSGKRTQITNYNRALLAAAPAAQWERFDVERDGTVVEAWLLKPADFDPTKKYPVVLDVHGGPN